MTDQQSDEANWAIGLFNHREKKWIGLPMFTLTPTDPYPPKILSLISLLFKTHGNSNDNNNANNNNNDNNSNTNTSRNITFPPPSPSPTIATSEKNIQKDPANDKKDKESSSSDSSS